MGLLVETVIYNKNSPGFTAMMTYTPNMSKPLLCLAQKRIIPCTSFENFPLGHKVSSVA